MELDLYRWLSRREKRVRERLARPATPSPLSRWGQFPTFTSVRLSRHWATPRPMPPNRIISGASTLRECPERGTDEMLIDNRSRSTRRPSQESRPAPKDKQKTNRLHTPSRREPANSRCPFRTEGLLAHGGRDGSAPSLVRARPRPGLSTRRDSAIDCGVSQHTSATADFRAAFGECS